MAEYFVVDQSGERFGPADVGLLNQWSREGRITGASMLEEAGTGQRVFARDVPGFIVAPPVTPPTSAYTRPTYVKVENNLTKAILSTLCCCLPVGVVAIVYASQVDGYARRGDITGARDAADKANTWANWSLGLGAAYVILYLLFVLSTGLTPSGRRFR